MTEPTCTIFGTLERRFVLNTSVNPVFIKFLTQSGATYGKSATQVLHSTTAKRVFHHKMLSRTSLARLPNKIDSSSVSKDGKIAVVHGLQTLCML